MQCTCEIPPSLLVSSAGPLPLSPGSLLSCRNFATGTNRALLCKSTVDGLQVTQLNMDHTTENEDELFRLSQLGEQREPCQGVSGSGDLAPLSLPCAHLWWPGQKACSGGAVSLSGTSHLLVVTLDLTLCLSFYVCNEDNGNSYSGCCEG